MELKEQTDEEVQRHIYWRKTFCLSLCINIWHRQIDTVKIKIKRLLEINAECIRAQASVKKVESMGCGSEKKSVYNDKYCYTPLPNLKKKTKKQSA